MAGEPGLPPGGWEEGPGGLLGPGRGLLIAEVHPLGRDHPVGQPGQDVFVGRGAAEHPAPGGLGLVVVVAQQLPLEVIPDQGAAAVRLPHPEGPARGRDAPQASGLDIQIEKQRIAQLLPERGSGGRELPSGLPQIGPDHRLLQPGQGDGDGVPRQLLGEVHPVHGPGHGDQLGAGVALVPAVDPVQQLPPQAVGDLVEAVQQHQQPRALRPAPGGKGLDGLAVFPVFVLVVCAELQGLPRPVHQLIHGDVEGGDLRQQSSRAGDAEEGHGLADAALADEHQTAALAPRPAPPQQLPDREAVCPPLRLLIPFRSGLPRVGCDPAPGRDLPVGSALGLRKPRIEAAVDLVRLQQAEAGVAVPLLLQHLGQIAPQGGLRVRGRGALRVLRGGGRRGGGPHGIFAGLAVGDGTAQGVRGPPAELHRDPAGGLLPALPAEAHVGVVVSAVRDALRGHQVWDRLPLPVAGFQADHLFLRVPLQSVGVAAEIGPDIVEGEDGGQIAPLLLLQIVKAVVAQGQDGKGFPVGRRPGLGSRSGVRVAELIHFLCVVRDQGRVQVQKLQPAPPAAQMGPGGGVLLRRRVIEPQPPDKGAVGPEDPQALLQIIPVRVPCLQHGERRLGMRLPLGVQGGQQRLQGRIVSHVVIAGHHKDVPAQLQAHIRRQLPQEGLGLVVVPVPEVVEIPRDDQELPSLGKGAHLLLCLPAQDALGVIGIRVLHKVEIGDMQDVGCRVCHAGSTCLVCFFLPLYPLFPPPSTENDRRTAVSSRGPPVGCKNR